MILSLLSLLSLCAYADDDDSLAGDDGSVGEEMTILGTEATRLPGASATLGPAALSAMAPLSTGEALQTLPGVVVAEEDGMSLRLNVGVRGLNPSRSGKLLVLEDGAPIGLGPYGEPALYYSPPVELVESIELIKGSGAILYGPQTIGGVLHYRTAPPPVAGTVADVRVRGGSDRYGSATARVGGRQGALGYTALALHQRYAGPRSLDLVRTAVHTRADVALPGPQRLSLKLSLYDEGSDTSYLGLTAPQFVADPQASFVEHDRFTMRRYALSARHVVSLDRGVVETLLYSHLVQRDWRRQDTDRSDEGLDYERIIDGSGQDITGCAPDCPADGSAVFFADSNSTRSRGFAVGGLETRLTREATWGDVRAGARLHREEIRERVFDGNTADTIAGELRYDAARTADAVALWALPRLRLWDDRVQLSAGARLELIWTRQEVYRLDQVDQDPPIVAADRLVVPLPGGGISVAVVEGLTLLAGVHRGFAPPRTKDAVSDEGDVLHLDAEYAWTAEVGGRLRRAEHLSAEVTAFWMDFSSQVVIPADGGQALAGGLVNGGESQHHGVEAAVAVDPLRAAGGRVGLPLMATYTWTVATLGAGWVGEDAAAAAGGRLPYAPTHQGAVAAGVEGAGGLSGQVRAVYVGEQFADLANTRAESIDGTVGVLPASAVVYLQARYRHPRTGLSGALSVKNLRDTPWISSRAPAGIQSGLPRSVLVEVGWQASRPDAASALR